MKKLYKYQSRLLPFYFALQHAAIFWKMGLGKTIMTIKICKTYADCKRLLVVTPFSAFNSWETELTEEHQIFVKLISNRIQRLNNLNDVFDYSSGENSKIWCIINPEGHRVIPEIADYPWNVVIIDESVMISNHTKISKFFRTNFRSAKHRFILCGTPAPESELQYYYQLKFLDDSFLSEKSWYEFRLKNFRLINNYEWKITEKGKRYLSDKLNKVSSFLTLSDLQEEIKMIYVRRIISLPSKLKVAYDTLESEFYYELDGIDHDTIFATQKYIWLRKLCGGIQDKLGMISYHKCNEIYNLISTELKDQQVLIWCKFIDEIQGLLKYLSGKDVSTNYICGSVPLGQRNEVIQEFKDLKIQCLIMQPQAMMYGSRFKADVIFYYSSPESLNQREQSEHRTVNIMSSKKILIVDFICHDTLEGIIIDNLLKKENKSNQIKEIVRYMRRKYT